MQKKLIKLNTTHSKTLSKICVEGNFLNEITTIINGENQGKDKDTQYCCFDLRMS